MTEIYDRLADLSRQEEQLAKKVDVLISNAGTLSRSLQRLDVLRAQAQSTQVVSSTLLSALETTATRAERISSNVRGLDIEQSRVKETLKYVEEVKELKACMHGVHASMSMQNWELAAEYIYRASLVPESIATGKFVALMVPSAETPLSPAETIREASDSLHVLFTREFKAAASARNTREITRFFKLFPQIGKREDGLRLYADFVCGIIAERADQALRAASEAPLLYANLMTGLFESIAKLITNHTPLINRFYGKDIDTVLKTIQTECDKQALLILTTMTEDRQMTKKVAEIKSYSFSFLVQAFLPDLQDDAPAPQEREVESKVLDALLTEMSIIFARWSLYTEFMRHCATNDLGSNALQNYITSKLESTYETMEGYFMRRSVERAFQLESMENQSFPVSSVVDDTMFILRKVTARALSTCQPRTMSAIFAVVRRIIEQDFAGILGRRMQEIQARIGGPRTGVIRSTEFEKKDRDAYCVLLNNLSIAGKHITRIVEEHQKAPTLSLYPDQAAALRIIEVLSTLSDRFNRGLEEGINVLYTVYVKGSIRGVVNSMFANANYVLTQQQYEDSVPFARFTEWDGLIKFDLTPEAYAIFLRIAVRAFIRELEKKLLTLKCNELGAIRLDKDVSSLINHIAGERPGIREHFDRVREICHVVNWSDEEENDAQAIIAGLGLRKIGLEEVEMIRSLVVVS